MRPGPRPRPSALAHIGPPSHKKPNDKEPRPRQALPVCPAHLDRRAKMEWNVVAPELYRCGVLTTVDHAILAMYCQMYSRWTKAEAQLRKSSLTTKDKFGKVSAHPLEKIVRDTLQKMTAAAAELGLTPAARAKMQVSPPPTGVDPADDEESLNRLLDEGAA